MNRRTPRDFKSDVDIRPISDEATPEELIEGLNKFINYFNFTNKFLSLQSNFEGKIVSVKIAANSQLQIEHFLGVIPKWRIILRQEGNGLITDVSSGWDEKIITLKNNGSEEVTLSLLIARE